MKLSGFMTANYGITSAFYYYWLCVSVLSSSSSKIDEIFIFMWYSVSHLHHFVFFSKTRVESTPWKDTHVRFTAKLERKRKAPPGKQIRVPVFAPSGVLINFLLQTSGKVVGLYFVVDSKADKHLSTSGILNWNTFFGVRKDT